MVYKTKRLFTGYQKRVLAADPHVRTLYLFNAISLIGGGAYGLYYGVFLYKNTFSLSVLALDGFLGGFGTWIGYLLGVILIRRYGYGRCIKTSFGLMAMVAFGTALIAHQIHEWFMVLALIKAIPLGMYVSNVDTLMIREMQSGFRSKFLQIKLALEFGASVLLPTLVGALISQADGYTLAFALAGFIYATALFVPVKLPKPHVSLNFVDLVRVVRRPLFKRHAANRMAAAGFNQINGFVGMIIPFIMLQSELSVGLLTSAIALVAAGVSFLVRKVQPGRKIKYGYGAYVIRTMASMLFVAVWTAPVMIAWQLINKLMTPLHDPLQQGMDIDNDSLIMGQDVQAKALCVNIVNNTLILAGTTVAYGIFMFIAQAAYSQDAHILQLLIMSFAVWRFINLSVSIRINQLASRRPQLAPA